MTVRHFFLLKLYRPIHYIIDCIDVLGVKSKRIADSQMSASSQRSSLSGATHGRADNYPEASRSEGGWIPSSFSQSQYLQIDLREEMKITAVETQGADGPFYWVKSYKVQFSRDGRSWSTLSQVNQDECI